MFLDINTYGWRQTIVFAARRMRSMSDFIHQKSPMPPQKGLPQGAVSPTPNPASPRPQIFEECKNNCHGSFPEQDISAEFKNKFSNLSTKGFSNLFLNEPRSLISTKNSLKDSTLMKEAPKASLSDRFVRGALTLLWDFGQEFKGIIERGPVRPSFRIGED